MAFDKGVTVVKGLIGPATIRRSAGVRKGWKDCSRGPRLERDVGHTPLILLVPVVRKAKPHCSGGDTGTDPLLNVGGELG